MMMIRNGVTKLPIMALENKSGDTRRQVQAHRWETAKKPRPVPSAAGTFPYVGKDRPDKVVESAGFRIVDQDVRSRCDYSPTESKFSRFKSWALRQQQGQFSYDFGWVRNCKNKFFEKNISKQISSFLRAKQHPEPFKSSKRSFRQPD